MTYSYSSCLDFLFPPSAWRSVFLSSSLYGEVEFREEENGDEGYVKVKLRILMKLRHTVVKFCCILGICMTRVVINGDL